MNRMTTNDLRLTIPRAKWRTFGVAIAAAACVVLTGAAYGDNVPAIKLTPQDAQAIARELGLRESERPMREMLKNWRRPKKIMVHVAANPSRLQFMQAQASGVEIVPVVEKSEALAKIGDVDALIASVGWCTKDLIAAGKQLRWVHTNAAGVNECALEEMKKRGIILTNQQRVFGPEISDHVIGLLLALTRGLDGTMRVQREARFQRGSVPMKRLWGLEGRTILIVGLGGVGTDVARKAHGMGMRVIATRASSREGPDFVEYVGLPDELPKLIGQADVVVNSSPLTDQTRGLFNTAMFQRMQKHAYYISVGRGPTTVTDDLLAALRNGTIGGAGLDVTDPEPLPNGHPLWSAPNCIITPHMSAAGDNAGPAGDRPWLMMREQMRRYIAGEKLYSIVDLTRGY
jgi:phosphoglycerate dehydrogenase-like enzyme